MSAPPFSLQHARPDTDVEAPIAYLSDDALDAAYTVWPPSSGREPESPPKTYHKGHIIDCRPIADSFDLQRDGFVFRAHASAFRDYFDEARVRAEYYPEMEAYLEALTGAAAVLIFDHNVRSAARAARGEAGVRAPVDIAHGDYTSASGLRRAREIMAERGYQGPAPRRTMLVNIWRPLHGPVVDLPLALCHAAWVAPEDLVPTPIRHYMEDDLAAPRHSGEIYSLLHNPAHRWYYASNMQADEVLVFKGFDSDESSHTRFTPHTGFAHPHLPAQFRPRESIEVRALVIDPSAE
jgi:hypothetical protein